MNFNFIDKILYCDTEKIQGEKLLSLTEEFYINHFPESPITPGTIILETMKQLADWYIFLNTNFSKKLKLIKLENIKFKEITRPGESLLLTIKKIKMNSKIFLYNCSIVVNNKIIAQIEEVECELTELKEVEKNEIIKYQNIIYEK